jgi:hypothetical protein
MVSCSDFEIRIYGLKCIIDLHAAPGSQNGMEHSASRDGSVDWPSEVNIQKTLDVINFLAQRLKSFFLIFSVCYTAKVFLNVFFIMP